MPRPYLIKARDERDLSQRELAALMGVTQATISRWESGGETPQPYQRRQIRDILKREVDSYPYLFELDSQWSIRGFKELMEMLRRQFIEALAKLGGVQLFGDVSLALVSSPTVETEEYLAQCSITLDTCWEWLSQGRIHKVERALHSNESTLRRFANTHSPFQGNAASLAVQATIMQIILATDKLDYVARERLCLEAVKFAQLSGDRHLLVVALEWYGYTYSYCYNQPQRAITILNDALSYLDNDTPLTNATICIGLAIAHAQDKDETNAKENEKKARDYAEMARLAMPLYPELDPLYQSIRMGDSELDQFEGEMYLYLHNLFPNGGYAQMAYDTFNKAMNKQAMNEGYLGQTLIHKADAARGLNNLPHFVDCLERGMGQALEARSQKRLSHVHKVMGRIPENWKYETAVQELQKDLSHAIIVVGR